MIGTYSPATAIPLEAVIVVGSGPAGLAVAMALAEAGQDVVVLESGGDVIGGPTAASQHAQSLNRGEVAGAPFRLESGRLRGLGGTGELWHGQCVRLHPLDMERRPWVAHSGWPLSYDELVPHYVAAEQWLDVSGRGYDGGRWTEHARLPAFAWDERMLEHDFTEYAKEFHLGTRFRQRIAQDSRLHVLLHATVARVVADGASVTGVEVAGPDGGRRVVTGRRVVIATGSIENARILQLSDPDGVGLGDGREHTGRWLQDHPAIRTAEVQPEDWSTLQDRYAAVYRGGRKLFPKVRLASAAQREMGLLDATAVFDHEHTGSPIDDARRVVTALRSRQLPADLRAELRSLGRSVMPVGRAVWRRANGLSAGGEPTRIWLQVWLEQAPSPDSRVVLGQERDQYGLRRARVDWRVGEQEMRTSRALTRSIGSELARLGLGEVRELDVMTDDDAWMSSVADAYHPSGTTRMSLSSADGVVDTDLQVHGVEGLYVVGGSVFPTSGYANPTLTIAALGLRLARHLQRQPAVAS